MTERVLSDVGAVLSLLRAGKYAAAETYLVGMQVHYSERQAITPPRATRRGAQILKLVKKEV